MDGVHGRLLEQAGVAPDQLEQAQGEVGGLVEAPLHGATVTDAQAYQDQVQVDLVAEGPLVGR
jgi:hypothetical protein